MQAVPYEPVDPARITTLGGRFATEFGNMQRHNPVALIDDYWEQEYYRAKTTGYGLTPTELRKKYMGANIRWEQYTNNDGRVNPELENIVHRRYLDDQSISNITASSYQDFASGAVSLAGALAGSLTDPVNIAIGLIPFGGTQALAAKSIATAGKVSAGRVFATRFAQGAVEDAIINGVIQQPIQARLEQAVGYDYTIQDYLANVAIGAAIGGTFRGGMGFLTDPMGRTEAQMYTSKLGTQNKAKGTLTATEQRVANMPAEDANALAAIKLEQELTGNFDGDITALFEATDTSHFSTVTKQSRDFGIFKEGRTTLGKELLDLDNVEFTPVSKVGKSQRVRGEIQIGEQVFSATSTSKKKVLKELSKQVQQYTFSKVAFEEVDVSGKPMTVARFPEDNGTLSALRGYGETKVEAMRMLNEKYNDFLERPRDFLRSQKDMRNMYPTKEDYRATVKTATGQRVVLQNEQVQITRDIDLLQRKIKRGEDVENSQRLLTEKEAALQEVNSRIQDMDRRLEIDFLNNSEHWYNDYVDPTLLPKTEAEYTAKLNNALNEKSSYAQEQLVADAEETKANVNTATSDKNYNTYRDEMYKNLELKQFVHEETRVLNDEYRVLREDNAKLDSESIDAIVTAYYNCTRGL